MLSSKCYIILLILVRSHCCWIWSLGLFGPPKLVLVLCRPKCHLILTWCYLVSLKCTNHKWLAPNLLKSLTTTKPSQLANVTQFQSVSQTFETRSIDWNYIGLLQVTWLWLNMQPSVLPVLWYAFPSQDICSSPCDMTVAICSAERYIKIRLSSPNSGFILRLNDIIWWPADCLQNGLNTKCRKVNIKCHVLSNYL